MGTITKIIPYNEYLQLKNAYINLKEKNKLLKQEKQKLESILKEFQFYLTDYKSSNNTIKILFQKVENNYKQLNFMQKNTFINLFKIRADNFKIINEQNNIRLKSKKYNSFYSSNEQQETFKKTINSIRSNNEIITKEYNETIDRYIEVINQLKREIKIKDELFQNNDKTINNHKNYLLNNINFKNLNISNNVSNVNIIKEKIKLKNKNVKNKFNKLIISSNAINFKIIQKNKNGINKDDKLKIHSFELIILTDNKKNYIFSNKLDISYNVCKLNILKENKKYNIFSDNINISSNVCKINILKGEKNYNNLVVSYNACELSILKENIFNQKYNNFYDKLFISSNTCELNILKEGNKLISNSKLSTLSISSNIGQINYINENKKLKYNFSISSNICEFNIIKDTKNSNKDKLSKISNKHEKVFEESILSFSNIIQLLIESKEKNNENKLIIETKTFEINLIGRRPNMNIISNSFEIIIPSITLFKEKTEKSQISIFKNLMISQDINEINILYDKKTLNNLKIINSNDINILPDKDKNWLLNNLTISSKISDITFIPNEKIINLDICDKVSKITIIQKKQFEEKLFKINNEFFFFSKIKNKTIDKNNKTEKVMFENYINSLNLGFDSRKKYKNYNIINKEKDEDSDNENDRLECEPIPSFLLCIEKMKKEN